MARSVLGYLGRHHVALLALFLALGGVSYAATDGFTAASNGALHACVKKHGGAMRLISRGHCKRSERSISWNKAGAAGLPGANGLAGGTGATGSVGPTPQGFTLVPLKQQAATEAANTGTARPLAPEVLLGSRGPISTYAKCLYGGNTDTTIAELYVKTSQDGAQWNSGSTPSALDTGTAETSRIISSSTASGTHTLGLEAPPKVFHVIAPDGSIFTASFEFGASSNGGPSGLFASQRSCFFHGYVVG
jgi:hypothetical protein